MEFDYQMIEGYEFPIPTVPTVKPPARTGDPIHRCQCLIIRTQESGTKVDDHCKQMVAGPDIPFCTDCEERHPGKENNPYIEVTIWGLQRGSDS